MSLSTKDLLILDLWSIVEASHPTLELDEIVAMVADEAHCKKEDVIQAIDNELREKEKS